MDNGTIPERKASRTALGTAMLRAVHQIIDTPPHILEDPLAVVLLGPDAEALIRGRSVDYQTIGRRLLRTHVVLRARYAEDRLEAAVQRGVSQYVLLGAGFDTFAMRQPAWAQSLEIFEVDHAATQEVKRSLMAAAGLAFPANTHFAAIDFEKETLSAGLQRSTVAFDRPVFFSWLGVTMYLHLDAIDAVLQSVASFPTGSEIILTFARPPVAGPSRLSQRVADLEEPWVTTFEPEAIAARLYAAGFTTLEFLSPERAENRYFKQNPQGLPAPEQVNIVSAIR